MQKGLSLVELAQRIQSNASQKIDFVAPTSQLEVKVSRDEATQKPTVLLSSEQGDYPIRPVAHDQIGGHLSIPSKYYDRMLTEAPELLASNVNTWFARQPKRRLVRTLGGEARAFLSDAYTRIENEEIAATVLPILFNIPGVEVVSAEITERRLYIQAVTPTQKAVKVGDEVRAGVVISNSEVGHGAVSIQRMVYRLVCLNGLVIPDGKFRANHVGRRAEEGVLAQIAYADDTRKADDRAVLLKVRDHVQAAVDETVFGETVDRMSALATGRELKAPVKGIEVLAQKAGLSEQEGGSILDALIRGGDLSAWGVVNAVTFQAHNTAITYDRAVEFEQLGGKLLNLPKSEWSEILEAA